MGIISNGIVKGFRTLSDGTVKITIDLQEMPSDKIGELVGYNNQFVKFYLTTENISNESILEIDNEQVENEGKSPSKRMYNILYRLWEKDKQGYEDFQLFYRFKMNAFNESLKNKLV